jgi:hypothetical protein
LKDATWIFLLLGAAGCGRAVTSEPLAGQQGAYQIECADQAVCVARAEQVCGGRYRVLKGWTLPLQMPDPAPGNPLLLYGVDTPRLPPAEQPSSGNTGPDVVSAHPHVSRLDVACAY